jgi:hypothetical protein
VTLNYCEVGEKVGEKVNKRGEEARRQEARHLGADISTSNK